jgi:DtxR family Mn-dependent transcriptional regulator
LIAKTKKRLSPSLEDYLEAVLELVRSGKVARVRDIAKRLHVGMPSVSVAMRGLAGRGLVNYDPYQVVTLTEQGQRLGRAIDHRHQVLGEFFGRVLGLEDAVAQANACRIEHAIDPSVLDRLQRLSEFIQACPKVGRQWLNVVQTRGAAAILPQGDCAKCLARKNAEGKCPSL